MNIDHLLSANAKSMRRSAIRDLLSVANKPEIISFGGGFPSPDSFPIAELRQIMMDVMDEQGAAALQYGSTEGYVPLREEISKLYQEEGLNIPIKNILVTTASQQAIDLLSHIFIDPGDIIILLGGRTGRDGIGGATGSSKAHTEESIETWCIESRFAHQWQRR